jgi:hypothetical protein
MRIANQTFKMWQCSFMGEDSENSRKIKNNVREIPPVI